VRSKKT